MVTVTQAPLPTEVTHTPIPFGANVVEVRLTIPAIGLDRRLQGGVNSQIILVDESSGFLVQRGNQAGYSSIFSKYCPLGAGPVPDGCDVCIRLSYNLPFSNAQGDGWLPARCCWPAWRIISSPRSALASRPIRLAGPCAAAHPMRQPIGWR